MTRLILSLSLCLPAWAGYSNGLGGSTLTCLDVDGDGYGVGSTCTGPDADDFDSTVHTAAQGITKYGTLTKLIAHLGYTTTKFWCLSPSGTDGTGASNANAETACDHSYAHFSAITMAAGDIVLMRANFNDSITPGNGSTNRPKIFLGYPGEQPVFDNPVVANAGFHLNDAAWIIIDGVKVQNQAGIGGSATHGGLATVHDILVRHIEGIGTGGGSGTIAFFNGLTNFTTEYNILHDNTSQHGEYNGANELPARNVTYRLSIAYNNVGSGFTFNGRCTNCVFDQLIAYNNGNSGLTWEMGVSNSFARSNLFFSNGGGQFVIYNYPGDNCITAPFICPFDQTGNLIENNTIYHTGSDFVNGSLAGATGDAIRVVNNISGDSGNLGGNIFRNNIVVNYGNNNVDPPIVYADTPGSGMSSCSATCLAWLSSSTWTNVIGFQADGKNGTSVFRTGATISTCAQAANLTTLSGCQNTDPRFVAASITYWNSVNSFDFRLLNTSPALHAGSPTGQPNYDLVGRAYATATPSMGSRERNLFAQGWNDLNVKLTASLCPPIGTNGSVDGNGGPYNYPAACPAGITIPWSGGFNVPTPTNLRLNPYGGGHTDYGGNEIYSLSYNSSPPMMTRITNPTRISVYDYNTGAGGIPDLSLGVPCRWSTCEAPSSGHTYSQIAYSPSLNKSFLFDVGGYGIGGEKATRFSTWSVDWNNTPPTWSSKDPVACPGGCLNLISNNKFGSPIDPPASFNSAGGTIVGCPIYGFMVWDTTRNLGWVSPGCNVLLSYDPSTNGYTYRGGIGFGSYNGGANTVLYDAKRQVAWSIGGGVVGVLDTSAAGTAQSSDITSLLAASCATPISSFGPGIGYDSLRDAIYIWPTNGLGTIYKMDLGGFSYVGGSPSGTVSCTTLTTGTGPGLSATTLGTWGRVTYSEALDAVVVIPGFNEDAFVYSLPAADQGTTDGGAGGSNTPVVTLTAPANGTTVSGTVTVSATATGNLGISSVQFTLDGASPFGIVTTSPFAVPWDTTKSAKGSHTLSAVATDSSGNRATAAVITATVNNSTSGGSGGAGGSVGTSGLGNSTLTCIDVDGDGYGVGSTCTGPDGDDFDSTVNTAGHGITKYGSLTTFIAHLGYTTTKFWCMSPSGNDGIGASNADAATACTHPFAHFSAISMSAGDIVLMRANWNDDVGLSSGGTAGKPKVFLAYPGEMPVFNNPAVSSAGFQIVPYVTVDGAILTGQADIKCSTDHMAASSACHDMLVRHVEGRGSVGSTGLGPISGFNDLHDWTIEYSVLHDDTSQHGVYLGSDELASTSVIIRKSIAYNNTRNGFTFNGRCTNCVFDQLISYNNGIAGLTWEMGVSNSFARSNLFFSNGTNQMVIYNYDGDSCSTAPFICPFDQTGNLIENNTMYTTGNDQPDGSGTGSGCPSGIQQCGSMGLSIVNSRSDVAGNLGGNTFRNNIITAYGYTNIYASVQYINTANVCNSTCLGWAAHDTWTNLIGFQTDGLGGSTPPTFRLGPMNYTCSGAASFVGTSAMTLSGCQNTNPQFTAASISYWNSVNSFDFGIQTASPAIHAGVSTGAPVYDLVGNRFASPPTIGAREASTAAASCDLNGDGTVNVIDVQTAVNQALGIVPCTSADLTGDGQCNIIDVQRLVMAATGGACVLGK